MQLNLHWGHYRPGLQQPRHAHDELHLSMVLRGCLRETLGATTHFGEPLSVVCKDPGTCHGDTFGPKGASLVRLSVPSASLADLVGHRTPCEWGWFRRADIVIPFLRLVHRGVEGTSLFDTSDADVVDLLAAITARPTATRGQAPQWLRRVVQQVLEDATRSDVAALASAVGVHPVYLARSVRRWYGTSLRQLQTMRRVQRAAAMLVDAGVTTSVTAQAAGCSDEAHLCRTFRANTGLTPGAFRRLLVGIAGMPSSPTADGSGALRNRSAAPD